MVRLEPTAKRVVEQLTKYGLVAIDSPTTGRLRDRAGVTWTWEVFMDQATFTRPGWRPRTVTAEKVSEWMFKWLFDIEETRSSLEFPMTLDEAVEEFGIDAVYRAFLKFQQGLEDINGRGGEGQDLE